jgi:exodeoxyribonuclease VIII
MNEVVERLHVATAADLVPSTFPGIAHGIDIDVYHAMPGISKSGLDLINRSPAHYFAGYLDPMRPPRKERAGQLEGQLAHCALLEPEAFLSRYITVPPNAPRRPTEAQWNAKNPSSESVAAMAWWSEFGQRHSGKVIITAAQYETAMRQAQNMRRLPDVAEALGHGRSEVSAMWIDQETGEACRCRPDWVADFGGSRVGLLDVKTYADASANEFRRQVARKRYHVQDAFYSDGYEIAAKVDVLAFVFVAVETEWPFLAQAMMLDDRSREQGREDYRRNLDRYAACRRRGVWPGYGDEIQLIDLPGWAFTYRGD